MYGRLLEAASPTQAAQERFITATDIHVKKVTTEKVNRSTRPTLTLEEHIRIRRGISGGQVLWAFMEILLGISLPNEIRTHADVVRLVDYLTDIPSWCGVSPSIPSFKIVWRVGLTCGSGFVFF